MPRSPVELVSREALSHLRYIPRIVARIRNWPRFLANYMRLRDEPAVYRLRRGGTEFHTTAAVDTSTIAVIYIKEDYGAIAPGSVVIDIGANIGVFSLYAASTPGVRVFAYEPVADTYDQLIVNVRANGLEDRVTTCNLGVTGARERRSIAIDPDGSPFSTLYGNRHGSEEIECVALQDVFDDNGIAHCDLLKLDCEGAEFEILYNAPSTLLNGVDRIVLEYHNQTHRPEYNGADLVRFLEGRGFRPTTPFEPASSLGTMTLQRHRVAAPATA